MSNCKLRGEPPQQKIYSYEVAGLGATIKKQHGHRSYRTVVWHEFLCSAARERAIAAQGDVELEKE